MADLPEHQDSDVVYAGGECPKCGENRVDYLANDDGFITCATCGHKYDLEPQRAVIVIQKGNRDEKEYQAEVNGYKDKFYRIAFVREHHNDPNLNYTVLETIRDGVIYSHAG